MLTVFIRAKNIEVKTELHLEVWEINAVNLL